MVNCSYHLFGGQKMGLFSYQIIKNYRENKKAVTIKNCICVGASEGFVKNNGIYS